MGQWRKREIEIHGTRDDPTSRHDCRFFYFESLVCTFFCQLFPIFELPSFILYGSYCPQTFLPPDFWSRQFVLLIIEGPAVNRVRLRVGRHSSTYTPVGPLKSLIPLFVDIPAPVKREWQMSQCCPNGVPMVSQCWTNVVWMLSQWCLNVSPVWITIRLAFFNPFSSRFNLCRTDQRITDESQIIKPFIYYSHSVVLTHANTFLN